MLKIHNKGLEIDSFPVLAFSLQNQWVRILISSYGATLQSFEIHYPGFEKRDVVLGYPDWEVYQQLFTQQQSAFFGAIVGPIAGRINDAKIPWKDVMFEFEPNEGKHLLHGGKRNFSNVNWQLLSYEEKPFPSVTLCLETQNAGISLPGNLRSEVRYTLKETTLLIEITSIALEDTVANPTQHAYFNPAGHHGSILDCEINVVSNTYLELNQDKLPTGKSIQCADLHEKKGIQINQMPDFPKIDHAFKLNSESKQARLIAPDGFQLTFTTNQPYMQVYIGGHSTKTGKEDASYHQYSGICLEQQAEPDAPNQLNFSDIYLAKGQKKTNSVLINFEQNK